MKRLIEGLGTMACTKIICDSVAFQLDTWDCRSLVAVSPYVDLSRSLTGCMLPPIDPRVGRGKGQSNGADPYHL